MLRTWFSLIALCGMACAASPSYSAAGIVNTGDYTPGPFAPNSILTLFGKDLAMAEHAVTKDDIVNNTLPTRLESTQVFLDGMPVPLLYVSETQINFLVPSKQGIGPAQFWVAREGLRGPIITITVSSVAPALFVNPASPDYVIASHQADWSVVSPDSPAHPGEAIILWAAGLGKTLVNPSTGELPPYISEIVNKDTLSVTFNGMALNPASIRYAGLSPGSAGLYQINLTLPSALGTDPEIRITVAGQSTAPHLKLAVR
jgi:uncharacterized protein (TIGR03437 family)